VASKRKNKKEKILYIKPKAAEPGSKKKIGARRKKRKRINWEH